MRACLRWIDPACPGIVPNTGEAAEALRSGNVFDTEFIACGKQCVVALLVHPCFSIVCRAPAAPPALLRIISRACVIACVIDVGSSTPFATCEGTRSSAAS